MENARRARAHIAKLVLREQSRFLDVRFWGVFFWFFCIFFKEASPRFLVVDFIIPVLH